MTLLQKCNMGCSFSEIDKSKLVIVFHLKTHISHAVLIACFCQRITGRF